MCVGLLLFVWGMLFNIIHEDELREIRRYAARKQEEDAKAKGEDPKKGSDGVGKVYMVPRNYLFEWCLYPHYLFEWMEWAGYWMIGGLAFTPGRSFLILELATMTPRAWHGKKWYLERFGEKQIGKRYAIIPGIL